MKQGKRRFFGFAVLLMAAMFAAAGCSSPSGSDDDKLQEDSHLISGKFESEQSGGDAVFYADYAAGGRSAARAVGEMSAAEKELTGKIEDGDIVFNLKGVVDTDTGEFYLSAGSSILVYQIAGTMTEDGTLDEAEAAVKIKEGNDWKVYPVAVTSVDGLEIASDASGDQVDGIPSQWFGKWDVSGNLQVVVTSYQYILSDAPDMPTGLIDIVEDIEGQKYTMIFQDVSSMDGELIPLYIKYVVEASGEDLAVKIYTDSGSEDYDTTSGYNIATADPETVYPVTLSRIANN